MDRRRLVALLGLVAALVVIVALIGAFVVFLGGDDEPTTGDDVKFVAEEWLVFESDENGLIIVYTPSGSCPEGFVSISEHRCAANTKQARDGVMADLAVEMLKRIFEDENMGGLTPDGEIIPGRVLRVTIGIN